MAAGGDYKFGIIISKSTNSGLSWNFKPLNLFGIAKGISFRTSNEGWMVLSFSENFDYTFDSGNNWNLMNVPENNALCDICFPDSLHGYSVGSNGRQLLHYQMVFLYDMLLYYQALAYLIY